MKVPAYIVACVTAYIVATPLVASDQLERLYQASIEHLRKGAYENSKADARKLLTQAESQDNVYYIVQGHYILGFTSKRTKDYGKAVIHYLEGARFAEGSYDPEVKEILISLYKNLGMIMSEYRHHELTHKFNMKGVEVARELSNTSQIVSLLYNEVYEFINEEKYLVASELIHDILANYETDTRRVITLRNNLGLCYMELGDYEKAKEEFNFVISQDKDIHPEFYSHALYNYGEILYKLERFEEALAYFEKSLSIKIEHDFSEHISESYEYIGLTYFRLNQNDRAISYFQQAENAFIKDYVDPDHFDIFETISEFYASIHQPELALKYENRYTEHLEAYIVRQREIQELDKKYNMELLTQRYFDLLEAEERNRATIRYAQISVGGVVALTLLILFIFFYRQFRNKADLERQLRALDALSDV